MLVGKEFLLKGATDTYLLDGELFVGFHADLTSFLESLLFDKEYLTERLSSEVCVKDNRQLTILFISLSTSSSWSAGVRSLPLPPPPHYRHPPWP